MQINIRTKSIPISEVQPGMFIKNYTNGEKTIAEIKEVIPNLIPKDEQILVSYSDGSQLKTTLSHRMLYDNNGIEEYHTFYDNPSYPTVGDGTVISTIEKNGVQDEVFYDLRLDHPNNYFIQNKVSHNSATVSVPYFHTEIEDIIVLKNNAGTDDNRVRKLDYLIQLDKLFYDRVKANANITLFSPAECKDLYDSFGTDRFLSLYEECEKRDLLFKKSINSRKFLQDLCRERLETGRIYIQNIDNTNEHSSWIPTVKMSNLCVEVNHVLKPIFDINDKEGEVGVCILSAINMLETSLDEIEDVLDITVRFLDEIIDYQDYAVPAAANFAKNRRSIGIGLTNLAAYLAKNKVKFSDTDISYFLVNQYVEALQYYALKASNRLAQEKGACSKFNETKYSLGILPIDTYNKNVDNIIDSSLSLDWESLREDIKKYGLRNSTLTCQMPCESCLKWDTDIITDQGLQNFHDICESNDIDWSSIEALNAVGWYTLKNPIKVHTKNGLIECDKLYYNGYTETASITLEDGSVIEATPNHRFLVKTESGEEWKRVYELNIDDDIVQIV